MNKYRIIKVECSVCNKCACGTYESIINSGWRIIGPLQKCRECALKEMNDKKKAGV